MTELEELKKSIISKCSDYKERKNATTRSEILVLLESLKKLTRDNPDPLCYISVPVWGAPETPIEAKETNSIEEKEENFQQLSLFDLI